MKWKLRKEIEDIKKDLEMRGLYDDFFQSIPKHVRELKGESEGRFFFYMNQKIDEFRIYFNTNKERTLPDRFMFLVCSVGGTRVYRLSWKHLVGKFIIQDDEMEIGKKHWSLI